VEQMILDNMKQSEHGSYLAMDPVVVQRIFEKLRIEMNKLTSMGLQPIIMTSPIVRIYFKRLVEAFAPDLVVLGYNEMDSAVEVQSVGVVAL
jgi:flagellar biosynthesis protein FlhA